MKTVPTLCATATVLGASSVGLSFGREKAPFESSRSKKNKPSPAREPACDSMPTTLKTSAMTTTVPSFTAPIPVAPASARMPISTRLSQDGQHSQRRIVRRMTSDDAGLQLPTSVNGYTPSDQDMSDADTARHIPTRRASWIKRLSSITNSQHSSRNTSPAPLSPTMSCSNGSMAFSRDGSTAPIVGRRSASPLPPNKLVKRASSVRTSRETSDQPPVNLRPSFRRPATSHQRLATMQRHSALLERTIEDPPMDQQVPSASTDSEIEYAQFFTARVTKERALPKRRGSSAQASGFRRIFPGEKHTPTLVLARAVTAGAEDVDDSATDDGESVYMYRPGTPLSIAAVFATKATSQSRTRPSTDQPNDDASRRRRSFSITDLLSSSSSKKQRIASTKATSGAGPLRRPSQRVHSAPVLPTMSRRPHSTSYVDTQRNFTDPAPARRDIATSAGFADTGSARHALHGSASLSSASPVDPSPPTASDTGISTRPDTGTGTRPDPGPGPGPGTEVGLAFMPQHFEAVASAAPGANQPPPSPSLAQSGFRPSRYSMAPSEHASTLVGSSDNELRALGSGDEEDADFQSETLFDSLRTGATRSTSGGARGPRIETIFDESPPSKVKVTALRDLLPPGSFGEHTTHAVAGHQSIAEEEESISTPVRTVRPERSLQDSPSRTRTLGAPLFPKTINSSPPSMPKPLSLGTLEWDSRAAEDDDSSRWSLEEADAEDSWVDLPTGSHTATSVTLLRQTHRLLPSAPISKPTTPQHLTADFADRDARSSIFDWSEQQIADRNSSNRTPPRPRTVHGKKDADRRGSRSVGRRAPSGLHARSQSVPVVPDPTGKRNTVVTNKFGTWGVGSKGVTEDWNDDFDFSELNEEPATEGKSSPKIDSGVAMVVPKSIQEQQNNVLANIGLLREWGLLIEELKEHRVRAVALGIVEGSHSGMWEEVDAMIDLADQEADHEGVPHTSPPSSPGFDEDAFEDPSASPSHGRGRHSSVPPNDDSLAKSPSQSAQSRRKSILPPNYAIFSPQSSPIPTKPRFDTPATQEVKAVITRPRKDSEAKARSVIEALQNRKSIYESVPDAPPTPSSKKVPFDTATLRRIVPYVSGLTRKVKDTIRDTEGLYSSPTTSPMHEEPPFSKMHQQDPDLAAQMKLMTVM